MDLQKILREFLNVIDFKLLSFNTDSVIVQDINYPKELYKILILPIEFQSTDNLRIFRSTKLNKENYCIDVLNTKYPKVPFSKNGIDCFTLSLRKEKDREYFSSELYHDDSLFITFLEKSTNHKNVSYRKCNDNGVIDIFYGTEDNNRNFEIYVRNFPNFDRKISFFECVNNGKRVAYLIVKDNNNEVYRKEIKEQEIELYLKALVYKIKNIVDLANNGIRTLNNNILEILLNYHDIATEFLSIISNSNGSINIIDELFELYFCNILSKKTENEMLLQRKLEEEN